MIILFILAPLLASILAIPLCRYGGRAAGPLLAAVPAALTGYLVYLVLQGGAPAISIPWAPLADLAFSFRADGLTRLFGLLIAGIGTLIVLYAAAYFDDADKRGRFLAYLFLFMASMLGVVFADHAVALFIFWEMTGIASYLLIGFERHKAVARQAALQALLTTGAGGLALLAGLILLGNAAGSLELQTILNTPDLALHPHYPAIVLLIVAGAAAKSAQFPLHFWLPNAMAAPTPASAYLHSSTMVKAGIYLLARLNPALGGTDLWCGLLTILGGATMVVGAWLSLQRPALKSMLAYSTITALGTLTLCIGIGTPLALKAFAAFLLVHALYKAALFMTAGSVIHATHESDSNVLGGLGRAMPVTAFAAMVAALSMAGLPPLFGFIGKETLYEALLAAPLWAGILAGAALFANAANVYVAFMSGVSPFWKRPGDHDPATGEGAAGLWLGPLVLAGLSLGLGLFPYLVSGLVISPAAGDTLGEPVAVSLKLWHGFNTALLMSGVTLLLGLIALALRPLFGRAARGLAPVYRFGPEGWYDGSIKAMLWTSATQTRLLQHGYLRYYLLAVIVCVVGMSLSLLPLQGRRTALMLSEVRAHELMIVVMIAIGALALTRATSRFAALACLGVVGYGVALLYVFYGAPDLAKTQIIVESLSVVLFALLAAAMPGFRNLAPAYVRRRDAILAAAAGTLMGLLVYFTLAAERAPSVADFYRATSLPEAHGRNVVNVILVDFRALDTLGEITVLAVAAFGAQALLRRRGRGKARS